MKRNKYPKLSIWRDIGISSLFAVATFLSWTLVYFFFGNPNALLNNSVTFLGGVLAISGLLFKQYMLKEVLEYLEKWEELGELLDKIIKASKNGGFEKGTYTAEFIMQKENALDYSQYVRHEMKIIPIVPLLTIFLYGCALLADQCLILRLICLYGMIHCVVYLAIAAKSSVKIAYAYPNLESTVKELKNVISDLEEKGLLKR